MYLFDGESKEYKANTFESLSKDITLYSLEKFERYKIRRNSEFFMQLANNSEAMKLKGYNEFNKEILRLLSSKQTKSNWRIIELFGFGKSWKS